MSSSPKREHGTSTESDDNTSATENADQNKRRTKYNKWDDNADGPDGLSSDERIREFLLADDGTYAKAFVNANLVSTNSKLITGKKRKCGHYSKHGVARECHQYFTEHGVTHRTPEDLRSRMSKWIRLYNKARIQVENPENESLYNSEEFKEKIKKIFKYYYDFEQYFKDHVTCIRSTRIAERGIPPTMPPPKAPTTRTSRTSTKAGQIGAPAKLPFLLPKSSGREVVYYNNPESSNNSSYVQGSKGKAAEQRNDNDKSKDTFSLLAKIMGAQDDSNVDWKNLLRVQEMTELRHAIESLLKSGADPNGPVIVSLTEGMLAASRRGNTTSGTT